MTNYEMQRSACRTGTSRGTSHIKDPPQHKKGVKRNKTFSSTSQFKPGTHGQLAQNGAISKHE